MEVNWLDDLDFSMLEKRVMNTEPLKVTRTEHYYAQRSAQNTNKWAVMWSPTVADAVAAELRGGTLRAPHHVRGPLSHDRARSLARHLNKQEAQQQ